MDVSKSEITNLLVDEFQDTSRLQWEILQLAMGESTTKLFVVGDPKQSIYSFRHADVRLFLSVTKELGNQGGVVHRADREFPLDAAAAREKSTAWPSHYSRTRNSFLRNAARFGNAGGTQCRVAAENPPLQS